jgi:hypothetical protein
MFKRVNEIALKKKRKENTSSHVFGGLFWNFCSYFVSLYYETTLVIVAFKCLNNT